MKEIVDGSISNSYGEAIKEWYEVMSGPFKDYEYSYCICGQYITKGSLIINKNTRKFEIIGFNCRDKYINNVENVSRRFATMLYNKNVINDWEHGFLCSLSKRTGGYSEKQKAIYTKLNLRVLNFLKLYSYT